MRSNRFGWRFSFSSRLNSSCEMTDANRNYLQIFYYLSVFACLLSSVFLCVHSLSVRLCQSHFIISFHAFFVDVFSPFFFSFAIDNCSLFFLYFCLSLRNNLNHNNQHNNSKCSHQSVFTLFFSFSSFCVFFTLSSVAFKRKMLIFC